jgi:3-hydroxyisobutyrate dehydrogenase-like beta-hydroxyacid dehydrogenase
MADAVAEARVVLSLVTADQALEAAQAAAGHITRDALYLDMNSVAPAAKRAAADAIEAAGARYIDVAVMAPVAPAALAVPLLLAGACAEAGESELRALGFASVGVVGAQIGRASLIKMVRSVLIKGIEAVSAECLLAAHAAGVLDEVLVSLGDDWPMRLNYNLERTLVHGERRAAEMEQAARTLRDLAVTPALTLATISRQRELGALRLHPVPELLSDKLERVAAARKAMQP